MEYIALKYIMKKRWIDYISVLVFVQLVWPALQLQLATFFQAFLTAWQETHLQLQKSKNISISQLVWLKQWVSLRCLSLS